MALNLIEKPQLIKIHKTTDNAIKYQSDFERLEKIDKHLVKLRKMVLNGVF
jgi:hypothetical protein